MRRRLLDILVCPDCRNLFRVEVSKSSLTKYDHKIARSVTPADWEKLYQENIETGRLICQSCNCVYPIVDYIPRILPASLKKGVPKTKDGFGYEWNIFDISGSLENVITFFLLLGINTRVYDLNFGEILTSKKWSGDLNQTTADLNYTPNGDFLKGKLVLDAGCGMGRYLEVAGRYAGEVVGVDISSARG